jgi:hypothetical protein
MQYRAPLIIQLSRADFNLHWKKVITESEHIVLTSPHPHVRNEHVGVALRKDLTSSQLCGPSCGIAQNEVKGIMIQGTRI